MHLRTHNTHIENYTLTRTVYPRVRGRMYFLYTLTRIVYPRVRGRMYFLVCIVCAQVHFLFTAHTIHT